MSAQGLEVLDRSIQATHEWVNELSDRLQSPDKRASLRLLRAVMTALRDVLDHDQAAHLAAQLPIVLRGLFYEGWRPCETPVDNRGREAFVARVATHYRGVEGFTLENDIEEAFRLLSNRLSPGETARLRAALPADLRALWPELGHAVNPDA